MCSGKKNGKRTAFHYYRVTVQPVTGPSFSYVARGQYDMQALVGMLTVAAAPEMLVDNLKKAINHTRGHKSTRNPRPLIVPAGSITLLIENA